MFVITNGYAFFCQADQQLPGMEAKMCPGSLITLYKQLSHAWHLAMLHVLADGAMTLSALLQFLSFSFGFSLFAPLRFVLICVGFDLITPVITAIWVTLDKGEYTHKQQLPKLQSSNHR